MGDCNDAKWDKLFSPNGWLNRLNNGRFPLPPLLLFILACLPRLSALGRYITPDELMWVYRSVLFREALLNGRFADTIITGHPGITTTWLGSLGISFQLLLEPQQVATYDWIAKIAWVTPDNVVAFQQLATFLTAGRLAVILSTSLGIVLIYLISRQLWGIGIAFLLALLLALDPFLAGLSGLLHVDALTTTFATLALLSLAGLLQTGERRFALFAGCFSGLALLSKSPAILLPPLTAVFILLNQLIPARRITLDALKTAVSQGTLWLTSFLVTLSLGLPALIVAPTQVWAIISGTANRHVGNALRETFFLGNVTFDHGLPFYPVALAYRFSPLVFLGLFLFVAIILWQRRQSRFWTSSTLLLLGWVFLFLVGITLTAKKFDRYALPTIPILTIFAVWGWSQFQAKRWARSLYLALIALQLLYLATALPYPLARYNTLLGGNRAAENVLTIGWGEAIGAAGQWLATQPDISDKTAVSGFPPVLAPFFPGQTLLPGEVGQQRASYIIQTIGSRQLGSELPANAELIHTVRFAGRDQGWIYRQSTPQPLPPPIPDLPAFFSYNNQVQLQAIQAHTEGEQLVVDARWRLLAGGENGRYTVKLTLLGDKGFAWTGLETALLNEVYFYPEHWEPNTATQVHYRLNLLAGMPPGTYQVELTLFDSNTQARLPLLDEDGVFAGVAYQLDEVVIENGRLQAPITDFAIETPRNETAVNGALQLIGQSNLPAQRLTGQTIPFDLFWQANERLPLDLPLLIGLGEPDAPLLTATTPLSHHASQHWQTGERIHEKYELAIPPDAASGIYTLWIKTADSPPIHLGTIDVVATERLFIVPDDGQTPLSLDFQGEIGLRGVKMLVSTDDAFNLTLYWQAQQQPSSTYTVFIHLIDANDQIIAQSDSLPAQSQSETWAEGEVIIDTYTLPLPADAATGEYKIALGLYTAVNGQRLAVTNESGESYVDNRVILPLMLVSEE